MSSTVISFQNVSFRYTNSESSSLSNIDLDIKKGECVLLCGASGCGKTTVTRLINGLIPHYYEGELSGSAEDLLHGHAGCESSAFCRNRT